MATKKTTTKIESKVDEVITRSTLVKETENHVFKITNYEASDLNVSQRLRGTITHKNGARCGDFVVNAGVRKSLSVNINMDCRELLSELLTMLADLEAKNIVEVDEFNYVKEAEAKAAAEAEAKAAAEAAAKAAAEVPIEEVDRKSTRLNSSHHA